MGDGADLAIDQMMTEEEHRLDFHTGNMSITDAYDLGLVDELGYEYWPGWGAKRVIQKVCRCCGKGNLHWNQVDCKWLLHDANGVHQCQINPLK